MTETRTQYITTTSYQDLGPRLSGSEQFDAAVARFLASRNSRMTQDTYKSALALFRDHAKLQDLDPLKADAILAFSEHTNAQRRDRGGNLANDTIRLRISAVKSLFSWMYSFNLTSLRPGQVASLMVMPEQRKLSPRDILTQDEAGALLASAADGRDRALIGVMLDAGLRVSEAISLQSDDIYPADARYWLFVRSGKGDKSREVELPVALYHLLRACNGTPRLFDMHRTTAFRIVTRTARAAGIEKTLSPHSLRHTHAHFLRVLGWPLESIGERLGHSNLDTTILYTRPASLATSIGLPVMPWAEGG